MAPNGELEGACLVHVDSIVMVLFKLRGEFLQSVLFN